MRKCTKKAERAEARMCTAFNGLKQIPPWKAEGIQAQHEGAPKGPPGRNFSRGARCYTVETNCLSFPYGPYGLQVADLLSCQSWPSGQAPLLFRKHRPLNT
eukprot:1161417-Pelagomonas_calceolata.AAC.4